MSKIFFLNTIDCDLRISSVMTRQASLMALVELFDQLKVSGHATWFINENDFAMTHSHADFLRAVQQRGDTLGVHDHVDFLRGDWNYDALHAFCSQSLRQVNAWLNGIAPGQTVRTHRFGCCFQHPTAYRVLQDLGYTICSDVVPAVRHNNHTGRTAFDNTAIPLGIKPYRHGPDNINEYSSDAGPFFQIPMLKATLTAKFWPHFERAVIESWLQKSRQLGQDRCIMGFGFHPYEIVDEAELTLNQKAVAQLGDIQRMLRDEYGAEFINAEECERMCSSERRD